MSNSGKGSVVTVFGGSGFVGRYIVEALARRGYRVNIASRYPERAQHLRTTGLVGKISLQRCSLLNPADIEKAVALSDYVVNAVGILYESGSNTFSDVQQQGAADIAKACAKFGVRKLVHISALGIESAPASRYASSKLAAEGAIKNSGVRYSILRPSVVFGTEDGFFNRFAAFAKYLPFVPVIGGGHTRFQPVYVKDVARAVAACLELPATDNITYELGGPEIVTLRQVIEYIKKITHRRSYILSLPFPVASLVGRIAQLLPSPPITADQVELLKHPNVLSGTLPGLKELGIEPHHFNDIAPKYLALYSAGAMKIA